MAQESQDTISRFDQVSLLTAVNVSYISTNSEEMPRPTGTWTVAAILPNDDLLLVKGSTVIRIPSRDVLKLVDYTKSVQEICSYLGDMLSHGKRQKRIDRFIE